MKMSLNESRKTTLGCPGTRDGDAGDVVEPSAALVGEQYKYKNAIHKTGFAGTPGPMSEVPPERNTLVDPSALQYKKVMEPNGVQNSTLGQASLNLVEKTGSDSDENQNNQPMNGTTDTSESEMDSNRSEMKKLANEIYKAHKKLGKKQGIKLASLNIRGRNDANRRPKFQDITSLVRRNRIAIMAVQETKMQPEEEIELMKRHPRLYYENNSIGNGMAGIGFVLNKDLVANKKWKHDILIPGRLSRLRFQWTEDQGLDIINIYVPNDFTEKVSFLEEVYNKLKSIDNWSDPIMMGDFNFVESPQDRFPEHKDSDKVTEAWHKIKKHFKWIDGWRMYNVDNRGFTYEQKTTGSMARIDRAYINKKVSKSIFDWSITHSGIKTDHKMLTMEMLKNGIPYTGRGIRRLGLSLIECKEFHKDVKKVLLKTQKQMISYKEKKHNTGYQLLWKDMKKQIMEIAKEEAQNNKWCKEMERNRMKAERHETLGLLSANLVDKLFQLTDEQEEYERKKTGNYQESIKTRYSKEGEKNTKYWFGLNKPKREAQTIMGLRDKNGNIKTQTQEMCKIATEYHKNLQSEPPRQRDDQEAINEMLNSLETELSDSESMKISGKITKDEIRQALKKGQNGKAPGMDGIPYEFYKSFKEPQTDEEREKEPDFLFMMELLFNDIAENGIEDPSFNEGAMSLIYKKKDKTMIENYRPITLTNTDYKLLTKTIASRLGSVAEKLIHPDQAGFVPGRSLHDHTKLTSKIIDYCEIEEIDGIIVSLDQEKAYDKIAHDYMWQVLEKMNIPSSLIKTIKNLYENAKTRVVVNGVIPRGYNVNRGVRQGDPMSCLLYDFAIEPLACAIRKSNLKGIEINGIKERVIVTLFADDTLVYMKQTDDLKILKKIIQTFCKASTARFNIEKTEYLPIGTPEFRANFSETRKLNDKAGNSIPENIVIVKDGQSMRTLGAWVGNKVDQMEKWTQMIQKQKEIMDVWQRMHLSFRGKELVLKALIQSKALFLAMVNGMPETVQEKMNKEFRNFLWEGKKGKVSWSEAIRNREEGGLAIPDIKARVEAIQMTWLKKYLAPEAKRPRWAYIVDSIIAKNIAKTPRIEPKSRISWGLQRWNESKAKWNKIPKDIKEMLKIARKYNTGVQVQKLSKETKEALPIWYHIGVNDHYTWNKKAARCLRENHGVSMVKDLEEIIRNPIIVTGCGSEGRCLKMAGTLMNKLPEKFNPLEITKERDGLDHTKNRSEYNQKVEVKGNTLTFNPSLTAEGDPHESIRTFINHKKYKSNKAKDINMQQRPAYRKKREEDREEITLYIATKSGICKESQKRETGAGIWHEDDSLLNREIKISNEKENNTKAELVAIMEAVAMNGTNPMTIYTRSENIIEGIIRKSRLWEDTAWIEVENKKEWKQLLYRLRIRREKTNFKLMDEIEHKENLKKAKKLAEKGLQKTTVEKINYRQKKNFRVKGAKLQSLTQNLAYKLIIREQKKKINSRKDANIEDAQEEIERITKNKPSRKQIWKAMQSPNFENKIGDMLWTIAQGRMKCGEYFKYIPEMSEKMMCECGEIESIRHIVFECKLNKSKQIWKEAKKTWKMMEPERKTWKTPSIGILIGLGTIEKIADKKKRETQQNGKRYQTIVGETMWMIWKKRNARIFRKEITKSGQAKEQWRSMIKETIEREWKVIQMTEPEKRKLNEQRFKEKWNCEKGIVKIKGNEIKITL